MPKTRRQIKREVEEMLSSGSAGGGYVMTADRLGSRPARFPKILRHGPYTATFLGIEERFPGDSLASARWEIKRHGKTVGKMHESSAYGWGRPTTTMNELRWAGPRPEGESDPRSRDYGIAFDQGPSDSHAAALGQFAKAADRLIEWREKHGHISKPRSSSRPHSMARGRNARSTATTRLSWGGKLIPIDPTPRIIKPFELERPYVVRRRKRLYTIVHDTQRGDVAHPAKIFSS